MLVKVTDISGDNVYINLTYVIKIQRIEDRVNGKTVDRLVIKLLGGEYVNLPYSPDLEEIIVKKVNYATVS